MTITMQAAVADALAYLTRIDHDGLPPHVAQRQLRVVQARHPTIGMELVWEVESFDGSLHYDVLLRAADGATASLSYCVDGALPWPLRGVRRWSDAELAQVNGQLLTMEHAVDLIELVWHDAPIRQRLIDACLVREELERNPIEINDDELQIAIDGFRRANRLYTVEDTQAWMEQRGVTHEHLEQLANDNLSVLKLRERITANRIDAYFAEHRAELATAHVARIECVDRATAELIYRQIVAGRLDFYEAAQQQFSTTHGQRALFFTLCRRELPDALAAAIFAARPGDVVPPIGDAAAITLVLALSEPCLDARTRTAIAEQLFEDWLAERRQAASITWHWGTTDRTPRAA